MASASGHRPARPGQAPAQAPGLRAEAKAVARSEDLIATGGKDGSVLHTGFLIKQGVYVRVYVCQLCVCVCARFVWVCA